VPKLQAAVAQAARDPALVGNLAGGGMVPVANTTQEFNAWLDAQRELLHKLIADARISLG
jgi:hypothetical protein